MTLSHFCGVPKRYAHRFWNKPLQHTGFRCTAGQVDVYNMRSVHIKCHSRKTAYTSRRILRMQSPADWLVQRWPAAPFLMSPFSSLTQYKQVLVRMHWSSGLMTA